MTTRMSDIALRLFDDFNNNITMEKRYYEYWKENNSKCKHDIARLETCRHCVFEALCMLEERKEKEKVIAKTQKNIF